MRCILATHSLKYAVKTISLDYNLKNHPTVEEHHSIMVLFEWLYQQQAGLGGNLPMSWQDSSLWVDLLRGPCA